MQSNIGNLHKDIVDKARDNKHLIVGYLFLALVFVAAISSVYYWEYKAESTRAAQQLLLPRDVGSGVQAPPDSAMCAQVITKGRNRLTGEIREFATPCEVEGDWEFYSN